MAPERARVTRARRWLCIFIVVLFRCRTDCYFVQFFVLIRFAPNATSGHDDGVSPMAQKLPPIDVLGVKRIPSLVPTRSIVGYSRPRIPRVKGAKKIAEQKTCGREEMPFCGFVDISTQDVTKMAGIYQNHLADSLLFCAFFTRSCTLQIFPVMALEPLFI